LTPLSTRCLALCLFALLACGLIPDAPTQALAADTVRRGFNVTVHLHANGIQMGAPKNPQVLAVAARRANLQAVSVPSATVIRGLDSSGYKLRFEVIDPAIASVDVSGLLTPLHISNGFAEVFVPPPEDGQEDRTLSYVFTYAEGHASGMEPVPLRVTFMP
jgi:hypothetical protein